MKTPPPTTTDLVTLVDERDVVLGSMDKVEAHRWPGPLHRASSVFLLRRNEAGELELLIQQRSSQKIVGAGQWANTCCGNVWPGESYIECAERRLQVELGIEGVQLQPITKVRYQAQCNQEFGENEIATIFVAVASPALSPNPAEVADTAWISLTELQKQIVDPGQLERYAPWFRIFIAEQQVLEIATAVAEQSI